MTRKTKERIALQMGETVRACRKAAGLTQSALAQKLRVAPSVIGNWEQGLRRLRHEDAFGLEKLFGRPAAYFLAVISDEEARVIQAMRNGESK